MQTFKIILKLKYFLIFILKSGGDVAMSVTDRMTSAVSKIADACEESARTKTRVTLEWSQDEIPQGYC